MSDPYEVDIPRRRFRWSLWRELRRIGFARRDCARAMWHGASVTIEDAP